tara:strand:+ start:2813 stop:3490 length:678 start_codon:yes stop_codon:yes gene_type:complete
MAYTTPRDWTAGEQVTHTIMNTHVRDNFTALSLHTHSGAAGDGASALANVDTMTFDHQGSDPSAPSAGHGTVYFKSDGLYFRNTGGSATRLALSSDVLNVGQIVEVDTGQSYDMSSDSGEKDFGDTLTITAGGAGRYYVASAVIAITSGHSSLTGTFKFYFDGSVIETETRSAGQLTVGQSTIIFNQTVSNPATSSKVFKMSVEGGGSGSGGFDLAMSIREIYTA